MSQPHRVVNIGCSNKVGERQSNDRVDVEEKDLPVRTIVCVVEMIVMNVCVPRRLMKAVRCDHRTAPVCVKMASVKIQNVDYGKNIHRSLLRMRESSCISLSCIL